LAPKSVQASDAASVPTGATTTDAPSSNPKRAKWQERFGQANLAHNGRLTLEEAKGGYRPVAKHFQEIDVEGKGYVTADDIRAWHALQKAKRQKAAHSSDPLRPRKAFRTTVTPDAHPLNTSATRTVTVPYGEADTGTENTAKH
jgi:hypothetical protein